MSEFFRGWRRKIGVVTLVLACVFIGIWIRSKNLSDSFISPAGRSMCGMIFNPYGLELFVAHFTVPSDALKYLPAGWETTRIENGSDNSSVGVGDNVWIWERFTFCLFENEIHSVGKGFGDQTKFGKLSAVVIPFWSIVLLLVLSSICLILDKPTAQKLTTSLSSYLKPWKRKMGAVTLALSCIFVGVWIRSQFAEGRFSVPVRNNVHYGAMSIQDGICLHRFRQDDDEDRGFNMKVEDIVLVVIPYWSIVIPLTALSAFLLLTKPR
jgi:hypothetical protein